MAKDHFKADVLIIPGEGGGRGVGGGCTFITQPIDKCIKKPFKESIKQSWQEWMHQDRVKTKQGNVKNPLTRMLSTGCLKHGSQSRKEIIVNSFFACGISNALDSTEDDHVSDDLPAVDLGSVPNSEIENRRC